MSQVLSAAIESEAEDEIQRILAKIEDSSLLEPYQAFATGIGVDD